MARTLLRELAEIVRPQRGRHRHPEDGVCTMELVAWMAGEKHSDHPKSASPIVAAFIRPFNDGLDDIHRQRLGVLAARMIGTRGPQEAEARRRQMLWDWMIGTAVPTWLVAAGRTDLATSVRDGRATALPRAIWAMDAYGYTYIRPVDDDRLAETVSEAVAAVSGTRPARWLERRPGQWRRREPRTAARVGSRYGRPLRCCATARLSCSTG